MSAIVLTRPIAPADTGTGGVTGLSTIVINGQPMLMLDDTTRGGKTLSVSEQVFVYAENRLTHLDWIRISSTADADSGYIADFDGTITSVTAHCEETTTNSKDIHVYIENTDFGAIASLTGGSNVTFTDTTLNLDFVQGQRIRLRAVGNRDGRIEDTVVKLTVKWRDDNL